MIYHKPCVVCGARLERPHPSQLARVSAHNRCKGTLITMRAAARRNEKLLATWGQWPPEVRVALAEAYNQGARHTRERWRMRFRMRAIARRLGTVDHFRESTEMVS